MILDAQHNSLILDAPHMVVKVIELVENRIGDDCRVEVFSSVSVGVLSLELARVVGDWDGRAAGVCCLGSTHALRTGFGIAAEDLVIALMTHFCSLDSSWMCISISRCFRNASDDGSDKWEWVERGGSASTFDELLVDVISIAGPR